MKNKIDAYIDDIYKDFDKKDKEVKELKEEMKSNLYDEIEELKKQGYNEEQCINIAIKNFGETKIVIQEIKDVASKQNKVFKVLLKIAVILFVAACVLKGGSEYSKYTFAENWEKNKPITGDTIIQDKIMNKIKDKEKITETDKSNFIKILDKYNKENNNGLYYIRIQKSNNIAFEYEKHVSKEAIINEGGGSYGTDSGWKIYYKLTDFESITQSYMWDDMMSSLKASNMPFNRLEKVSFKLFLIYWILIVIYFLQKVFLRNQYTKAFILLLSAQTFLIFNCLTFEDHKAFMIPMTIIFTLVNIIYERFCKRKSLKYGND